MDTLSFDCKSLLRSLAAFPMIYTASDERDEIIVWDADSVWIYTQDRPFTGQRIYKPTRNPLYNDSNYRATVSLPGWKQ
jgi:hypothetical protein